MGEANSQHKKAETKQKANNIMYVACIITSRIPGPRICFFIYLSLLAALLTHFLQSNLLSESLPDPKSQLPLIFLILSFSYHIYIITKAQRSQCNKA